MVDGNAVRGDSQEHDLRAVGNGWRPRPAMRSRPPKVRIGRPHPILIEPRWGDLSWSRAWREPDLANGHSGPLPPTRNRRALDLRLQGGLSLRPTSGGGVCRASHMRRCLQSGGTGVFRLRVGFTYTRRTLHEEHQALPRRHRLLRTFHTGPPCKRDSDCKLASVRIVRRELLAERGPAAVLGRRVRHVQTPGTSRWHRRRWGLTRGGKPAPIRHGELTRYAQQVMTDADSWLAQVD